MNHSYPPTDPAEPDAESLELLTQISHAAAGQDPQAQILAIVHGLLDIRLNQQHQILEQAHYRELNARDEASEKRTEEARERELTLQAELATLRGRLDQPSTSFSNQDTVMGSSVGEVPKGGNTAKKPPAKPRAQRRLPPQVPETAPSRNLRSRSKPDIAQPSLSNIVTNPLATALEPANLQLMSMPTSQAPAVSPAQAFARTAPIKASAPAIPHEMTTKKPVKKLASQLYRLTKSELPDDIGGLQVAIALHLRILWGLIDAKQIPGNPSFEILNTFRKRFSTEAELHEAQVGEVLIPPSLVKIGSAISMKDRGKVPRQILLVEEHILEYIQACLAKFGLIRWCPDLRQSPYSLYNCACRIIALDTFKQAIVSHAYMHLKPNTTYASDTIFLTKLYNHFIYHFMLSRYNADVRNPGSVKTADKMSPQYRSRLRLCSARLEFLNENGYPQRYKDLIDPKATSDDEENEEHGAYIIKRRPERSIEAEQFIRLLDQKREETVRQDPRRRWRERKRIVPTDQPMSTFRTLPDHGLPIDYYDPTFYNRLQPVLKMRIATQKVAFLPVVADSFTQAGDELLNDEEFTEKWGEFVFCNYLMAEEVNGDDEWLDDDLDALFSGDENMEDINGDEFSV